MSQDSVKIRRNLHGLSKSERNLDHISTIILLDILFILVLSGSLFYKYLHKLGNCRKFPGFHAQIVDFVHLSTNFTPDCNFIVHSLI